jgi:hypothetical protein
VKKINTGEAITMMQINETLTLENQLEKIGSLLLQGHRFVTMTVVDKGEEFDIFYHFDLDYKLTTFQLVLPKGAELPSISGICFAAVIISSLLSMTSPERTSASGIFGVMSDEIGNSSSTSILTASFFIKAEPEVATITGSITTFFA